MTICRDSRLVALAGMIAAVVAAKDQPLDLPPIPA